MSEKTINIESPPDFQVDIAILVAASIERKVMLECLNPLDGRDAVIKALWNQSVYYIGKLGLYPCVMTKCDQGSSGRSGAQAVATMMIERWNPRALIVPGIAFGAALVDEHGKRDQEFCEVLVSTRLIPYEAQRFGKEKSLSRYPIPEAGLTLLNRARNLDFECKNSSGKLKPADFGEIFSGDKLVDNLEFKEWLLEPHQEAVGGEMEGAGTYAAASNAGIEWLVVKAICDWGDGTKDDSVHEPATRNAVQFVVELLSEPGLNQLQRARSIGSAASPNLASTSALMLQGLRREVNAAARELKQASEAASNLAQQLQSKEKLTDEERTHLDIVTKSRRAALEAWINAYEEACQRFLAGNLTEADFGSTFMQEIREMCSQESGETLDIVSRDDRGVYSGIWTVFEKLG